MFVGVEGQIVYPKENIPLLSSAVKHVILNAQGRVQINENSILVILLTTSRVVKVVW